MNVEGAVVERLLGRSIMPRFHAGWSLGTFTGAGLGAVAAAIIVLEGGHVVGHGTHAELLESSPTYVEIIESQLTTQEAS